MRIDDDETFTMSDGNPVAALIAFLTPRGPRCLVDLHPHARKLAAYCESIPDQPGEIANMDGALHCISANVGQRDGIDAGRIWVTDRQARLASAFGWKRAAIAWAPDTELVMIER